MSSPVLAIEMAGEAGVPFIHGVKARNEEATYRKVRRYMHTWYDRHKPDDERDRGWAKYDRGVRVKLSEVVEVKDFEGLWREMIPIKRG